MVRIICRKRQREEVVSGSEVQWDRQCRVILEDRKKMGRGMVEEIVSGTMATSPLTPRAIDMSFTGFLPTGQLMVN